MSDSRGGPSPEASKRQILIVSPSPSPEPVETAHQIIARRSIAELACDKAAKVKVHRISLEDKIRELETLAHAFRKKVKGVSKEFEKLKAGMDGLTHDFEVLEEDHIAALASLGEEKATATSYLGILRNREKELALIYQNLEGHPDELDIIPGCFSQVTDLDPIPALEARRLS